MADSLETIMITCKYYFDLQADEYHSRTKERTGGRRKAEDGGSDRLSVRSILVGELQRGFLLEQFRRSRDDHGKNDAAQTTKQEKRDCP